MTIVDWLYVSLVPLKLRVSMCYIQRMVVSSWLRRCATSWKVAGSIPDGVIAIFHWLNPSGRNFNPGVGSASAQFSV
jgi:hypothetical protein